MREEKEKLYTVTSMMKRIQVLPDGRFADVYEITFVTKSGITSSVAIPADRFTKEYAARKIQEEAETIEAIMQL